MDGGWNGWGGRGRRGRDPAAAPGSRCRPSGDPGRPRRPASGTGAGRLRGGRASRRAGDPQARVARAHGRRPRRRPTPGPRRRCAGSGSLCRPRGAMPRRARVRPIESETEACERRCGRRSPLRSQQEDRRDHTERRNRPRRRAVRGGPAWPRRRPWVGRSSGLRRGVTTAARAGAKPAPTPTPSPAAAPATVPEPARVSAEVVVSAPRIDIPLQENPAATTVVGGSQLAVLPKTIAADEAL